MMMWRDPGQPADSYYEVRPEITDAPKTKFRIKAGKTLSVRKWQSAFTADGELDISKTLGRIHRGGVHPSIRGEVWEFLLGCFDPKSTFDDRSQKRQRRRVQYAQWKEECRLMFPLIGSGRFITAPIINDRGEPIQDPLVLLEADLGDGAGAGNNAYGAGASSSQGMDNVTKNNGPMSKKEIQWKLTLHQIGLDVKRTDRALVFYEKQENLAKLWDILAIYAWIDGDVGYCQGMSDLCSPMLILLDNEADAFWCFERLMRRLRGNFRSTGRSVGVEAQLSNLATITQVIDPKLHQHLETLGGGDYLFAIRMLMVLFRREFSFGDSLYLWEMMWALEYDPDLFLVYEESDSATESSEGSKGKPKSIRHYGKYEREILRSGAKEDAPLPISVFLVASVLKEKGPKLLKEARGLDDVVKILNDIAGDLDAKKACVNALKLHKKYLKQAKKV
ncbi:TBC1 domain family member 25-like [Chenopodium quinoa]|uniref:TBC1 domain family member 25-like n=1 Tax=Chenopodium quinoa TaxID=63459 RepID=UPI000B772687|nr:TBC1 domain family member 25-like [Chenopodium quinoa]